MAEPKAPKSKKEMFREKECDSCGAPLNECQCDSPAPEGAEPEAEGDWREYAKLGECKLPTQSEVNDL